MINGISSDVALQSGNISALKKALDTEKNLMGGLLAGMQGSAISMEGIRMEQNAKPQAAQAQNNSDNNQNSQNSQNALNIQA